MQAVILAAGMGKRLGELTQGNTKCMVKVNGVTLIERMLSQLDRQKLDRIVIVIGYEGQKLADYISTLSIKTPIVYVNNDVYYKTNNIWSLYLAKDYLLADDTLLLESDLIFDDSVLDRIHQHPYPNLALVAKFESWMDGTVVTIDDEMNIKRFIGTSQFQYEEIPSYYKTVNIYKFSKDFSATQYIPFLEAYCKALGDNEYYEQVLKVISFLNLNSIKALPLEKEHLWYEIDDIQDLDIAESIFCEDRLNQLSSRYGGYWRYPHILDFCYLVNPYFPNSRLMAELKSNFETLVQQYPSGRRINNLLAAKNFKVKLPYIVVGNGAAELIKSLMENILTGKMGFIYPTFEEYPNRGAEENRVVFTPADFSYSASDIMEYFDGKDISSLLLVNPDNPSGNFIPKDDVLKLADWAASRNIRLIVDESFVDFADGYTHNTLLDNQILEQYPSMIVVKSISKSFGVAGLRLGIMASADKELIRAIGSDIAIWNINSIAEFYMQIYGKYEKDYGQAVARFIAERERFEAELVKISWLKVYPSQANYFLCEVRGRLTSAELAEALLKQNILIKDCSTKKGFGGRNFIRIAIRDTKDNNALLEALKTIE